MSNWCQNFWIGHFITPFEKFFYFAKFINRDEKSVDIYPGQIQYFFEHSIYLSQNLITHKFAFVRWYKAVSLPSIRYHFGINDDNTTSLVEIRSFDPNTFRQTFSRFGHMIQPYFGYAYKFGIKSNGRLLYCIKFCIILT